MLVQSDGVTDVLNEFHLAVDHFVILFDTHQRPVFNEIVILTQKTRLAELQKRADRADQSVLFFLAGANFWEKHAKNC